MAECIAIDIVERLQEDVILKVTSTAICGSDLHLYLNFMPGMKAGDILGHEVCSFAYLELTLVFLCPLAIEVAPRKIELFLCME